MSHFAPKLSHFSRVPLYPPSPYRIDRIASNSFLTFCNKLFKNGFPHNFIDKYTGQMLDVIYTPKFPVFTVPKKEIIIVLPYLGPISHAIKRKLIRLVHKFYPTVQLKIVFKRGLKLENLFSFKVRLP